VGGGVWVCELPRVVPMPLVTSWFQRRYKGAA